jgi:hypothetical protein
VAYITWVVHACFHHPRGSAGGLFELASTPGKRLMATFPTDEQIKGESEDLSNSIKSGKLEPKGQELNMSKILHLFTTDLQKYHFRQIEKPQRAQALLAFKKVLKAVILKANLIISTNNNVRRALISP